MEATIWSRKQVFIEMIRTKKKDEAMGECLYMMYEGESPPASVSDWGARREGRRV